MTEDQNKLLTLKEEKGGNITFGDNDYARSYHVRDINRCSYKTSKNDYVSNKTRSSHGFVDRNHNSFAPLLDYNIECYK